MGRHLGQPLFLRCNAALDPGHSRLVRIDVGEQSLHPASGCSDLGSELRSSSRHSVDLCSEGANTVGNTRKVIFEIVGRYGARHHNSPDHAERQQLREEAAAHRLT